MHAPACCCTGELTYSTVELFFAGLPLTGDLAPQLGGELDAELILDDSKENVWVRPG